MTDTDIFNTALPVDTRKLAWKIRRHALEMTHLGRSSHIGSVLSMADIVAVLYGQILRFDPEKPKHPERDRFILSKGHAGAGVYAALAERGFFETSLLSQHYQNGSIFSGHVSHKGVPGVEFSTGSLGHGLSVAVGMALSAKFKELSVRTQVILSDGECDEGSNWEAILFAAHHHLGNLTVTVDYNKIQSLKPVSETLALEPFYDKWQAFGWHTQEICGHDHDALVTAYMNAEEEIDRPSVIIASTTKGKGITFMEDKVLWHYRSPQDEEYKNAVLELEEAYIA